MRLARLIVALASAIALSGCGGGSSGAQAGPPVGPPGTLDPSFGSGGKAVTPIGSNASASAMALQPDGKIVAAGSAKDTGNHEFLVVRWNADGSLDTAFGRNGVVTTALGSDASAGGLALQPDGKIVVSGQVRDAINGGFLCAMARYNGDGTLDAGFGAAGLIVAARSATGGCLAIALQPDGSIVTALGGSNVVGDTTPITVLRLRPDGTPDGSFGIGGQAVVAVGPTASVTAIAVDPDGRIIVGGETAHGTFGGILFPFVARVDSKGMLDPTFGQAGLVVPPSSYGSPSFPSSILFQPDGKILIGGISRLLANGVSDPSFVYVASDTVELGGAALQSDGKVVIALSREDPTTQLFFFDLQRVGPDGRTDTSFGNAGLATAPFAPFSFASVVALQSDGRIVAVGATQIRAGVPVDNLAVAVARFFGN